MAKTPVLGLVKTRLGREIGPVEALRFYRATLGAVVGRLAADPRFETSLAIAPDAGVHGGRLPERVPRRPQGRGDLGVRMQRLIERQPPGPVVVIGTDIPGISAGHVAEAFRLIGRADVVFGPAADGGFWLVGFKRRPATPRPFAGVRWSHAETLADACTNLSDRRIATAATLSDVDARADLVRYGAAIGRRVLPRDR